LIHPLYRGEYRHGAMRTVARGGTLVRVRAPEAEVLRIAHPELRIWPAALLAQIDAALVRPRRKASPVSRVLNLRLARGELRSSRPGDAIRCGSLGPCLRF
jgi:hypothetical protein